MKNTASTVRTSSQDPRTTLDFTDWLDQERTSSGIPENLWKANITTDDGWELLETLVPDLWDKQRQQTYVNAATARTAKKYISITDNGAWVAIGWQPPGIEPVPIVKPKCPRWDKLGQKFIKYETPKGSQAMPFFAWIPYGYGLGIAKHQGKKELKAYQERIGVCDIDKIDAGFWGWAIERNWTITITEGVKKSLALIANGILSIGLRGITQWRLPRTNSLSISLKPFATKKRRWQIALDQDSKPTTRAAVRTQVLKLGRAIEKRGTASVLEWSANQGKGIDDVLLAAGEESQQVLAAIIQSARSIAAYQRDLNSSLEVIARLQDFTNQIPTTGERLAKLPELAENDLLTIDSSMGTGKTYRIVEDLIAKAKSENRLTIILAPNNNLCSQVGESTDFPHIHTYGTRAIDTEALISDIYHRGGVVLCLDSLPRLIAICPGILKGKPLVIVDEVNQTIANLATAGTLGKRQPEGVEALGKLVQSAHSIAVAEYGIPGRCIELIQSAARGSAGRFLKSINSIDRKELKVITICHRNSSSPWTVNMFRCHRDSGYLREFFAAVEQGGTHYFATTSKAKAKQLESLLTSKFPDKNIVLIDSETTEGGTYNTLFRTPDGWLRETRPDILITTTTMQSGISIDGGKSISESYFSHVWGHFPSLTPDLHLQMLARVRPGVVRNIWIPEMIQRSPEESSPEPWTRMRFWREHAKFQANFQNLEQPGELDDMETAVQKFCAKELAIAGIQKSIAFEYLKHKLEEEGHIVNVIESAPDKAIAQEFAVARQQLESDEAEAIAGTLINPEVDTVDWAIEELCSTSSTVKTRRKAKKILARERFPRISFDNLDEALSLVTGYGAIAKAAELRAGAENPEAERILERSLVADILSTGHGWHRLPKRGNQTQILADIGILKLISFGEEYSRNSELVQEIAAAAIRLADAIWQFFGLNIRESQDVVSICHRLLKRLGYTINQEGKPGAIVKTSRTGPAGDQVQHYQIVEHPSAVYQELLSAARARRELLAVVSKGGIDPLENDCKPAEVATPSAFSGDTSQALPFDLSSDMDDVEEFDVRGSTIDDPDDFGLEEIDD
jgi:hypothetical protein